MFGLDCATQTSPMETVASLSNWCSKVVPLLVVLSSPPEAVATQYMLGSASYTEMAVMRPAMLAGPTQRQARVLTQASGRVPSATVVVFGSGCCPEPAGSWSQAVRPTATMRNAENRRIRAGRTMMSPGAGTRATAPRPPLGWGSGCDCKGRRGAMPMIFFRRGAFVWAAEKLVEFLYTKGEGAVLANNPRSEERRVGKECRSRWSPYH